ncbi:hypothetical protein FQA39_LY15030 [Lamprigera yunnana]|nr:hypothetical protein FQA39_LY15030 [Lamprigera yunnana]
MSTLEATVLNSVGPALILAACILFYFTIGGKRPLKKTIDMELLNSRIFMYKPEPLVDCSKIDSSKTVIQYPAPDESNPECLNLAKVNYLNFLNNSEIKKDAEQCIRKYGVGSCGPRGFYGTMDVHLTLENQISKFMELEETVVYSYGFSTVSSAISAYCKRSDIIFCDEKIGFAAIQGFKASKSTVVYFKHNDTDDLEIKLKEYKEKLSFQKKSCSKFLIVEGIYSATGLICPLPKLMELREKYKLRIFIDESLSFGVLGKKGRGVTEHFDVDRSNVDMIMGSLEGALGSVGGYCVGAYVIMEHQRLYGLGYCFSASLPPVLCQVAISALDAMQKNPEIIEQLQTLSYTVDGHLKNLKKYIVLSDPLSPLKVITTKSTRDRLEKISQIHAFCSQNSVYMICDDGFLKFHLSITLKDSDIDKLIRTLYDAAV